VIEEYIRCEQESGRIVWEADPQLAAYVMMSVSFFRAFVEQFFGKAGQPPWSKLAEHLVATMTPERRGTAS